MISVDIYGYKIQFKINMTNREKKRHLQLPASVAQLDARQTSDQEVMGSTPAGSTTFFCGE